MATKKSTKRTTSRTAAKAPAKTSRKDMSVKECMAQSSVLKLHITVITVLSFVVCALVVALFFALKRN